MSSLSQTAPPSDLPIFLPDASVSSGRIRAVYRLVVNRFRERENAELQLLEVWPQQPVSN